MTLIAVLIPDFEGNEQALQVVLDAQPDVLNHNTETVPRLYRRVRPHAQYQEWTMNLLRRAANYRDQVMPSMLTKSGIMVGLGETKEEMFEAMDDLVANGLDVLTVGQYLQPTKLHIEVAEYIHPDVFAMYKEELKGLCGNELTLIKYEEKVISVIEKIILK